MPPFASIGVRRHLLGFLVALVVTWTGLWIALWLLPLGAVVGFIGGLLSDLHQINDASQYGIHQGLGWLGIFGDMLTGGAAAFLFVWGGSLVLFPVASIERLLIGAV